MTVDDILDLGQRAMLVTLMVSGPMLLSGMVVGLVISVLQSVTQVQEITLTFVPKIVVVLAVFLATLPWIGGVMITYMQELFLSIENLKGA